MDFLKAVDSMNHRLPDQKVKALEVEVKMTI